MIALNRSTDVDEWAGNNGIQKFSSGDIRNSEATKASSMRERDGELGSTARSDGTAKLETTSEAQTVQFAAGLQLTIHRFGLISARRLSV